MPYSNITKRHSLLKAIFWGSKSSKVKIIFSGAVIRTFRIISLYTEYSGVAGQKLQVSIELSLSNAFSVK